MYEESSSEGKRVNENRLVPLGLNAINRGLGIICRSLLTEFDQSSTDGITRNFPRRNVRGRRREEANGRGTAITILAPRFY